MSGEMEKAAAEFVHKMYPSQFDDYRRLDAEKDFLAGWAAGADWKAQQEIPLIATCLNCDAKFELSNAACLDLIRGRDRYRDIAEKMAGALESWAKYEEEQIAKHGPYVSLNIPRYIAKAKEALRDYAAMKEEMRNARSKI